MSYNSNNRYSNDELTHVHEVQGSVQIAEREEDPHQQHLWMGMSMSLEWQL